MKIIQVFCRYIHRSGEETSAERIARHLESGGHEVHQFWRSSSEWTQGHAPSKISQVLLIGNNELVLSELKDLQRHANADIWILHNIIPVVSLGVYRLAAELNVPVVQWLHNYRPISISGALPDEGSGIYLKEIFAGAWRRSRLQTLVLGAHYTMARIQRTFSTVRVWIAVSEDMKLTFIQHGWFPDRMATLHHSWDIQDIVVKQESERYFLFLGRLIEEKGVHFLVELFSTPEMRQHTLIIAGEGGARAQLQPSSPPNVVWIGYVSGGEKTRYIRNASAVLFPSMWKEPLSTVAFEAYEQETPVISSNMGGMPEIVLHGKTGLVLQAGDLPTWKNCLLTTSETELQRLGKQARIWLETHVNQEIWNERFIRILRDAALDQPELKQ